MPRSAPRRRYAFSLVELVVVVVILGIVSAIAIPRLSRGSEGASEAALIGDLAVMRRAIDMYTELAPNFKSAVIDRQVIGPYDMEQELGLIGGNIFHGELSVDQLFHMRPAPGFADFRTPIRGLYHGSCATHGGGGVNGIPGWQAYRQARRDGLGATK